ncbi:MAG: hypothetical protein CMJ53_07455 [Planctomycetaceae bacterium]|nr:hypothetical protein [Planctomycetaceae bacterium]
MRVQARATVLFRSLVRKIPRLVWCRVDDVCVMHVEAVMWSSRSVSIVPCLDVVKLLATMVIQIRILGFMHRLESTNTPARSG